MEERDDASLMVQRQNKKLNETKAMNAEEGDLICKYTASRGIFPASPQHVCATPKSLQNKRNKYSTQLDIYL